tara:strand:- start:312 stop:500 length:189 start_codon:yes stop_codon:yes gene_type:complete
MQLLDVKLGRFPSAGPYQGFARGVNGKHEILSLLARIGEYLLKDLGDVFHEVHRIVENKNIP